MFIKLTDITETAIVIETDHIISIFTRDRDNSTWLDLDNDTSFCVKESVEEIIDILG